MVRPLRWTIPALGLALLLGPAARTDAQADPQNFLFNSGQNIQPFFDGWSHNPDGSFEFYFGYLNRNYVEEAIATLNGAVVMDLPRHRRQGIAIYHNRCTLHRRW